MAINWACMTLPWHRCVGQQLLQQPKQPPGCHRKTCPCIAAETVHVNVDTSHVNLTLSRSLFSFSLPSLPSPWYIASLRRCGYCTRPTLLGVDVDRQGTSSSSLQSLSISLPSLFSQLGISSTLPRAEIHRIPLLCTQFSSPSPLYLFHRLHPFSLYHVTPYKIEGKHLSS